MTMTQTSLGAELQQMSHLLEALIIKETDREKKKSLREQLAKVFEAIQALVDANVDAANNEYRKARKGIEAANGDIVDALKDLGKVAETIQSVGKAVDKLGKLAAAAA